MQGIIAIEKNLSRLADLLETEGYDVVDLENTNIDSVDAIVLSGVDNNIMNMQDIQVHVPIINAAGKSTEEILEELERL
ncbi:YkuS family protein [Dendrosporobacter sp. 1207_IL3150]|uniref:YkuS family protein n=1 Tax=Dendrosporobacter sp. 1207_IL3150 TaxID=3084054 RepID=UPI002FD9CDE8